MSYEEGLMIVSEMGINTVTVISVKNWLVKKYWKGKI